VRYCGSSGVDFEVARRPPGPAHDGERRGPEPFPFTDALEQLLEAQKAETLKAEDLSEAEFAR
jgi:hypothetical protein